MEYKDKLAKSVENITMQSTCNMSIHTATYDLLPSTASYHLLYAGRTIQEPTCGKAGTSVAATVCHTWSEDPPVLQ